MVKRLFLLLLPALLFCIGSLLAFRVYREESAPLPRSATENFSCPLVADVNENDVFPNLDVSFTRKPADFFPMVFSNVPSADIVRLCRPLTIRLTAQNGALHVNTSELTFPKETGLQRIGYAYRVSALPTTLLRMPDGSAHPQYHLLLRLDLTHKRPLRGTEKVIMLTELVIDPADGTVDAVLPDVPENIENRHEYLYTYTVLAATDNGLPTRFCGNEAEQALQRYLYLVSAMHDAASAERLLPAVRERGQALVDTYAAPELPFPDCWGEAADTARRNARRIIPYLIRADEANCYDNAELADFLNSPLFARLFGNGQE